MHMMVDEFAARGRFVLNSFLNIEEEASFAIPIWTYPNQPTYLSRSKVRSGQKRGDEKSPNHISRLYIGSLYLIHQCLLHTQSCLVAIFGDRMGRTFVLSLIVKHVFANLQWAILEYVCQFLMSPMPRET